MGKIKLTEKDYKQIKALLNDMEIMQITHKEHSINRVTAQQMIIEYERNEGYNTAEGFTKFRLQ